MPERSVDFEIRSLPIEKALKTIDAKEGIVAGYWSAFDVEDEWGDSIAPGAFAKTIAEWGPGSPRPRTKFLFMHDPFLVLGKPMTLKEDGVGLFFEAKIVQTTWGRDVLMLYQDGIITEHSIGFRTMKAEPIKNTRRILEIRLYEGSAVLWGANSSTPTTAVKAAQQISRLSDRMVRAEKALRRADFKSEELPEALELLVKQWCAEVQTLEALVAKEPSLAALGPHDTPTPEPLSPADAQLTEQMTALTRLFSGMRKDAEQPAIA